jgi:hypothetical protein
MAKRTGSRRERAAGFGPAVCGFACPHADFPPADTAGICRTMSAVYCRKLGKLVNKNMPCKAGK